MVEIPPKLMMKLAQIIPISNGIDAEISRQPFVISTSPPQKAEIELGSNERIGEKEVITTKKMAIIAPTEITLSDESSTV